MNHQSTHWIDIAALEQYIIFGNQVLGEDTQLAKQAYQKAIDLGKKEEITIKFYGCPEIPDCVINQTPQLLPIAMKKGLRLKPRSIQAKIVWPSTQPSFYSFLRTHLSSQPSLDKEMFPDAALYSPNE